MEDFPLLIPDGGNLRIFPKELPGFFPVQQFSAPFVSTGHRTPQILISFRIHLSGLQESGVPPEDLGQGVTSQLAELRVDVFDFTRPVGDDDADRTVLNGEGKFAQLGLGPLSFGDVANRRLKKGLPTGFDPGEQHPGGEVRTFEAPVGPFKIIIAFRHGLLDDRRGQHGGGGAIRLLRRGKIPGTQGDKFRLAANPEQFQGRRIARSELPRGRREGHQGVPRALKQDPVFLLALLQFAGALQDQFFQFRTPTEDQSHGDGKSTGDGNAQQTGQPDVII